MTTERSAAPVLLTIGHSNHEWPTFVAFLQQHGVTAIADVRSRPFSRTCPHFTRSAMHAQLTRLGLAYAFLGDALGARRTEPECYVNRQARYDRIAELPAFREGLTRIRTGLIQHRIVLLCAEKDPITCHRMVLVCKALRNDPIQIQHILQDGSIETHDGAERRLLAATGLADANLFDDRSTLIEQAYHRQGLKIAWAERDDGSDDRRSIDRLGDAVQ